MEIQNHKKTIKEKHSNGWSLIGLITNLFSWTHDAVQKCMNKHVLCTWDGGGVTLKKIGLGARHLLNPFLALFFSQLVKHDCIATVSFPFCWTTFRAFPNKIILRHNLTTIWSSQTRYPLQGSIQWSCIFSCKTLIG